MNRVATIALALLGLSAGGPAAAQRRAPETVFSCALRGGRSVTVTNRAGAFTYRYGTARSAELTLTGNARSGNLFFMRQRYAGPQMQLRFTRGPFSYIVYAMEGNGRTGVNGVAGLVVLRGTRRISDQPCRRYADFRAGFEDLDRLPEDSETYTAM